MHVLLFMVIATCIHLRSNAQGAVASYYFTYCVMDNVTVSDEYALRLLQEDRFVSILEHRWETYQTVLDIKSQDYTSAVILTTSTFDKSSPTLFHSFYEGINGVAKYRSVAFYITIQAPNGIDVTNAPSEMLVGKNVSLNVKLTGTYPSFKGSGYFTYEYISSDKNVADFSGTNKLIAKTPGKTTITVKAYAKNLNYSGSYYIGSKSFDVTVKENAPESITITPAQHTLSVNESYTLESKVSPAGVSYNVIWKSADPTVATVSNTGKITGIGQGKTTITATTDNGVSATCDLTVDGYIIDGIRYTTYDIDYASVMPLTSGKYKGNITIPQSVTIENKRYIVDQVDHEAFHGCTELESIILPELFFIGNSAFQGCTKLSTIRLNKLSIIGPSAFEGCTNLKVVQFILDNGPLFLFCKNAFKDCNNLKKVYIDDLYRWTYTCDFSNVYANPLWPGKAELYVNGTEVIDLIVPASTDNKKNLKFSTFAHCSSIESITLQEGIESSGEATFQFCDNLKVITLPSTLKEIKGYSFAWCDKITTVNCYALTPPNMETGWNELAFNDYYAFFGSNPQNIELHVPKGCLKVYASAPGWNMFGIIIDDLEPRAGIDDVAIDFPNFINVDVYNIQGMRLIQNATEDDIKALKPGIYIIGNKKISIR